MSTPTPNPFNVILQQLKAMPLWGKQVIYLLLRNEMEATLAKSTLDRFGVDDLVQLMRPQLTAAGQRELEQPSGKASPQAILLLQHAAQNKVVIDICIATHWTLEQCTLYLLEAIDNEWLERSQSGVIMATIDYLAGKIRLGEYLVRIGRLSPEQLEQALRTQQYIIEALGEKTGLGNVLINLGYITRQDSEGILFLKQESKNAF